MVEGGSAQYGQPAMNDDPSLTRPVRARRARQNSDGQAATILAGAERLFLRHGFAGTSMEMLVAETGGSKRDIYRLFGDKRALFQQIVTNLSNEGALSVRVEGASPSLETTLTAIARSFLDFLLSERGLNFHRLMVADAARLEEAGHTFICYGPATTYRTVAEHLRAHLDPQLLSQNDADHAARVFVDSFSADLQLRALLGDIALPSERDRRVEVAVRVFFGGLDRFVTLTEAPVLQTKVLARKSRAGRDR